MTRTDDAQAAAIAADAGDEIAVRTWFVFFAACFALGCAATAALAGRQGWTWLDWRHEPLETLREAGPLLKLLVFGLYISLCCTFLPLPTGGIVAAVATREAAVAGNMASTPLGVALATALLVGTVGAAASTLANLNDYHLFTWMLRNRRLSSIRQTRTYRSAARWFAKSPFFLLVVFNVIPIPVDVVRMLATTYRYPRLPFAAANFLGRFLRYGVIAFVTYWWNLGWIAVVALLALGLAMAAARGLQGLFRKPANPQGAARV